MRGETLQITVGDLLGCLTEKDSFELRIFYESSCVRLFTGIADDAVLPELFKERVKNWTTFWLSDPLKGKRPFYVLQIETFRKRD